MLPSSEAFIILRTNIRAFILGYDDIFVFAFIFGEKLFITVFSFLYGNWFYYHSAIIFINPVEKTHVSVHFLLPPYLLSSCSCSCLSVSNNTFFLQPSKSVFRFLRHPSWSVSLNSLYYYCTLNSLNASTSLHHAKDRLHSRCHSLRLFAANL